MSLRLLAEDHATSLCLQLDKFGETVQQSRTNHRTRFAPATALVTWVQQNWDTQGGQETRQQAEVWLAEGADVKSGDVFVIGGKTTVVTSVGDVSYGLLRFNVETRKPVAQTGSRGVV